jgi:DNA-binding response OmpR family regulator
MSNNLDRRPEDVLIDAVMEASGMGTDAAYEFDVFRLEIDEQRLLRNGSVVHLAPKEFETLRLLIAHHGRLVSKQMLLDHTSGRARLSETMRLRSGSASCARRLASTPSVPDLSRPCRSAVIGSSRPFAR